MRLLKLFSLYLLLHAGFSDAETPVTLCATDEKINFSCSLKNNKTVSLCSSAQISATAGYLQYRFGKINHTPELEYPQEKLPPAKLFSFGHQSGAKSGVVNIAFNLNKYGYIIVQSEISGSTFSGVIVKKQGKIISYLACNNKDTGELMDLMDLNLDNIESDLLLLKGGTLIDEGEF